MVRTRSGGEADHVPEQGLLQIKAQFLIYSYGWSSVEVSIAVNRDLGPPF
jgi:hypothetical protein